MRTFQRLLLCGSLFVGACGDRAPGPAIRTGPALLSWISHLPIPDSATTVHLADSFVAADGRQSQQGAVEGTVKVDSLTFRRLWREADTLDYHPVSSYTGPYRVAIMTAATGGRYRLTGALHANYMLTVLNPIDYTISVQYAQITGWPF